jgi:hypothetical protein
MATLPPIPERTRTLCAPSFGPPSKWEILELPIPKIENNDEVLIRVHAASINPTDVGGALGRYWPAFSVPYVNPLFPLLKYGKEERNRSCKSSVRDPR